MRLRPPGLRFPAQARGGSGNPARSGFLWLGLGYCRADSGAQTPGRPALRNRLATGKEKKSYCSRELT